MNKGGREASEGEGIERKWWKRRRGGVHEENKEKGEEERRGELSDEKRMD